ncbi:MAG: hypothetical protein JWM35_48, partial [Verrucomicrobia bacterium]|nr:hypothetical protein [Verrucomicrobiota bacterium]
ESTTFEREATEGMKRSPLGNR